MFPGLNMKRMMQAMKAMGIKQEEIPAKEVIILLENEKLLIKNPKVSKIDMMGQTTFQIIGSVSSVPVEPKKEDIELVASQAGVSSDEAEKALKACNGDIAEAIIKLKGQSVQKI